MTVPLWAALVGAAMAAALVLAAFVQPARLAALMRRGKQQWEAAFDSISDGIVLVDAEGVIQRSNAAFSRLAGRPVNTVGGRRLSRVLFGEPYSLDELLATALGGHRAVRLVRRSGTLNRLLRIAATPVTRPVAGASLVVVVADITEQQAIEAQLIQSEKMAAVGTLVSGVAHELNNPLTSIAGLSELLLEQSPAGSPAREHLKVINEQADRAGHIVRDLLIFARKGTGERSAVDLDEVAQRTLALLSYDLRRANVAAQLDVEPDLPRVLGDRHQLQQVMLNLVTNAIHALGKVPEPRRVTITARLEGDRVVLRVADTGPGISEDVRAQMFSPFFTTKPPGEGTGLGLFVSYGIAEAHGGSLTAESRIGEGATFILSLPASAPAEAAVSPPPADAAPTPAAALPGPGAAPAAAGPGTGRILVVDDDPLVRQVVSALFAKEGHRVDAAVSGAEALRLAQSEHYDLVIADRLASAGDVPIAAALTRLPGDIGARLILSTSARLDGEPPDGRLLRKPFDLRELKKMADEVFRQSA